MILVLRDEEVMINHSLEFPEGEVRDAVLVTDGDSEIGQVSLVSFFFNFFS